MFDKAFLFYSCLSSPALTYVISGIKTINMVCVWNNTEREENQVATWKPDQRHFVHHKSHSRQALSAE